MSNKVDIWFSDNSNENIVFERSVQLREGE